MGQPRLLQNGLIRMAIVLMGVILGALVISSLLVARYLPPTSLVSDIGAVLCALIASAVLLWAWRTMDDRELSKRVWGLVTIGIILWTLAESTWAYYELVLKVEVPYPSVADLFWLTGYVPVYAALIIRSRSLASTAPPMQRWVVLGFILVYSALTVINIGIPLIQSFDPTRLVEGVINVAYPLADWGLCILVLVIVFSLESGRFAVAWRLFGLGILLMATGDLLYFYADWNGFYYPGGQLTFISGVIDVLYNLSYLMIGLSILAYSLIARTISSGRLNMVVQSHVKMNVLVFLGPKGKILSVSDNFMNLVHAPSTQRYIGMEVGAALGLDAAGAEALTARLQGNEPIRDFPVLVKDAAGQPVDAYVTSLFIQSKGDGFDMIALVLRADPPAAGAGEFPLHEDQRMLIQHYLDQSGARTSLDSEVLRAYFMAQIDLLHSLIQQFSGSKVADKLLEHLGDLARTNNWQFAYSGQEIRLPAELVDQALTQVLVPLLEDARRYAGDMADQRMVDQEMTSLDKTLPPDMLRIVDKYGLRFRAATAIRRSLVGATAGWTNV